MIRDIRPTDNPEVVVAHGQLYDLDKVVDAGLELLDSLIECIQSHFELEEIELKTTDGDWAQSLSAHVQAALKKRCLEEKEIYDVSTFWIRVNVPPFHIRFYPFGSERLIRENGELRESFGSLAEELNPEPQIVILPVITISDSMLMSLEPLARRLQTAEGPQIIPFPQKEESLDSMTERGSLSLSEADLSFLKLQLRPYLSKGIEIRHLGSVTTVAFSVESFGLGEGELRIDCVPDD